MIKVILFESSYFRFLLLSLGEFSDFLSEDFRIKSEIV